jgi:predicted transcriptional regulator
MDDTMTATAQGMRASGSSVSDIADTLGVSRATVYRRLSTASTTSDDDHNLSQN